MSSYTIVDGSYFCFYRYYALVNWWRLSHQDGETHIDNLEFFNKFKKLCKEYIQKKFKDSLVIFAKDCKRENIWRNAHYPTYKAGRKPPPEDMSKFFIALYEICEELSIKVLAHPSLEADDCAAIYAKHLLEQGSESICIVASDHDYFQLPIEIKLVNLAFKNIGSDRNPAFELFCKKVKGDSCDNINPIFSKCGPKTLLKYFNDISLFNEHMKREKKEEIFALNSLLIDFNNIPQNLVEEFTNNNISIK
jgi:DNA polymerase I